MDRRRAAGALLALAACSACIACVTAAPTASNQTALDLYDADSAEGCYYNFQHYGEGDRIMTNEPCLNCTCHNRMLMCYLRVCPFTKPIGQDCSVEKRADQCCPIVTCPDVPVDLLTSTPTTSPAEYGTTGIGRLDKYGCSINGKYFSEGSKVPPSPNKPCEHCYCIRNMTTCVMQECTLHVDGCTPIYHKEVCCPIRYSCDHQDDEVPMLDDMTTTVRPTPGFLLTTTTIASVTQIPQECVHEDQIFPDGALIKTEKACEHCYCMKGDIVCVVQECGTPMENEGKNCTSLTPREGQCCPDTYICEGDEATTEIPTETATEIQKEVTTQEPIEEASEVQKEAPTEVPIEETSEKQKEATTEELTEVATEKQTEIVTSVPTEETPEVQKEAPTKIPSEEVTEKQEEIKSDTEIPTEATKIQKEPTTSVYEEPATEAPVKKTTEIRKDDTTEVTSEKPQETPTEVLKETVTKVPTEITTEVPHEGAIEVATEVQNEEATEVPQYETTEPNEVQKEAATKIPEEQATEIPIDEATKAQQTEATKEPTDTVTEAPTEVQKETATELPKDEATDVPIIAQEGAATDLPIEEVTDAHRETVTEVPTDKTPEIHEPEIEGQKESATEGSGETATESIVDKITETATQSAVDIPIESSTQVAYESATQVAAEASTEGPTEAPTTFLPPRRTSVEGSGYRNEPDELFTESPFLEQETEGSGYEEEIKKPTGTKVTSVPIEETTSLIRETEVTSAKDVSVHGPTSIEPPSMYTEQPTTEPDKGENTVPSDESTLLSIFDIAPTEASATAQAGEMTTSAVEQETTKVSPEDKQDEQQAVTTPESSPFTERADQFITTELTSITEDGKVTKTSADSTTRKEQEDMITEKLGATEYFAPTTEKEEIEVQTTVFDEKESKATTVQLPDTPVGPAVAETAKPEHTTTEVVQEYTSSDSIIRDQGLSTSGQPPIEDSHTTPGKTEEPETTSINPLENEIHEEITPIITPGVIPGEGNCLVEGITYNNDTVVPTTHKCQSSCRCMSSIVKCEEIMCAPPPENMGSCKAVYDSEETCCPYYTCDQAKETPPLKPHSQMSGTELPITQGDCAGELCNKQEESTQAGPVAPECTSGDCGSEIDNKETEQCGAAGCEGEQVPVLVPAKEEDIIQPDVCSDGKCISSPEDCAGDNCQLPTRKDCTKDGSCEVPAQETCEGANCDVAATPTKEILEPPQENTQGCANIEDCKSSSPDVIAPTCEGADCTIIKQDCSAGKCESKPVAVPDMDEKKHEDCGDESDCNKTVQGEEPQTVCTEEICIKKDITQSKPLPVCTDESCVQQATVTPSSDTGLLSTELPEPEDKHQTVAPAMDTTVLPETIETGTENQIISDVSVTEHVEMDATDQPATQKHDTSTETLGITTAAQESSSKESAEEETSDIPKEDPQYITKAPELEGTPTMPVTESEESDGPQTKPSVSEDSELSVTEKSQKEATTAVAEVEEPQDVTHRKDIVTEAPIYLTSSESTYVPSRDDEESTKQQSTKMPETPVTEREEVNTELPESLPTELPKQPEETSAPEISSKSPEQEPSMAEEPIVTEALPEPTVTESQLEFVTTVNEVDVSQMQDEQDFKKSPSPTSEVPEAVTEVMTEIPTKNKVDIETQDIGTTPIVISDEKEIVTETPKESTIQPQEPITDVPHVSIMDEEDNTESPQSVAPQQTVSQDAKTESTESPTTVIYDAYTEVPEMPMSEEQIKHTLKPEVPVTESRDSETASVDQENTTPLVYSVTTPHQITDGLREGVITEKEQVPTEVPVTEAREPETSAPVDEENMTKKPDFESQEIDSSAQAEKSTIQPESPSTEIQKIATEIPNEQEIVTDIPVSPVTEHDIIGTEGPKTEDLDKQTELPDTSVSDLETKSPEVSTEKDILTEEPASPFTEYPETVTVLPEHPEQGNQKSTEYPVHQATEKPEAEEPITETQKTDEGKPAIELPKEPEQRPSVYESSTTESQEVITLAAAEDLSEKEETPVVKPHEIPKIFEEESNPITEAPESATKATEDQYLEPHPTKEPQTDEQLTTVKIETPQPEYEKQTQVPEIITTLPDELDAHTNAPLAPVTEPQEISTVPVKEAESVTESQEPMETVTTGDEKPAEIPETSAKEPQDSFTTTTISFVEQELQTVRPEDSVTEKEDAIPQVSEILPKDEVEQQTEIPKSPITEPQEIATKLPDTQTETELPVVTTQQEISSNEPKSPVTESQEISTDSPASFKPEEQEPYTNAPVSEITAAQDKDTSTSAADQEIPDAPVTQFAGISTPESTTEEAVEKQTMIPESNLNEPQLTSTEVLRDVQTEAPASHSTESLEVLTNVPEVLIPEEQPTYSPTVESQKPTTNIPKESEKEEIQTESPLEKPQEPAMPEQPSITEEIVTDVPKKDITELKDTTDASAPTITEKLDIDIPVTEPQGSTIYDEKIASTEEFVTPTSQPKLEYSETTPYLVELEEHTHKIEIETSTIPEDLSVPQTTEYEKPEEPLTETEIKKQTDPAVTTEKIKEVSSLEPMTDAPTTALEYAPTEAGSLDSKFGSDVETSSPKEQTTERSDVDETRRTTIASHEVEDKAPDTQVTEKEAEPTAQPGADEKYTTTQPPEKSTQATSQEVSSEEDSIPLRTTTVRTADEATTFTPIDKATVSEPKPTELPSPISPETVKPTSSEEVPSEEEAGSFPPSGTGYGQEPDYGEEDQAFGPGTCRYGGKVYVSAQQIPRDDPCDFCFCFRSDIICLQQSCPPPIHGCHEEPIQGFCCPRYECPVSMATTLNVTTTTTTTTTTLPPHFLAHAYNGAAQKRGCLVKGHTYKVGEVVRASSGPCLHCTCGGDGQMKCDPKVCTPEPMLRQMIAAAVSAKRRR